jgi:protein-S-isoprenylcysteine O-methyltransferase Ste14
MATSADPPEQTGRVARVKPFFREDSTAGALVAVTLAAAVLVEWGVTLRERTAREEHLGKRVAVAARTLREVTLFRTGERREEDRNTKWLLVGSVAAGLVLGGLAQRALPGLAFPDTGWTPTAIGVAVMWAGIALRAWAIATLGRFFRRDIQVAEGQVVVRTGPYSAIRHPAYTGNLLMLAGFGIVLANWASLAVLVVIPVAGHLPRILVEDALLIRRLGEPYRAYAATTARLMPGVW